MEKLVNKSNLDINLLQINWGLMSRSLHDGFNVVGLNFS